MQCTIVVAFKTGLCIAPTLEPGNIYPGACSEAGRDRRLLLGSRLWFRLRLVRLRRHVWLIVTFDETAQLLDALLMLFFSMVDELKKLCINL